MKKIISKIYLLLGFLLTLASCAKEGPYELGKLEYDIKVSMITPSTAVVSLTIPQNASNVIVSSDSRTVDLYVTDKPYNTQKTVWGENEIRAEVIGRTENRIDYFLSNLIPSTTYHVVLDGYVDLNKDENIERQQIYTESSFLTAKDGDFSGLGEASYQLLSTTSDITGVSFKLPEGMSFPSGNYGNYAQDLNAVRAYASTSPDMSNAVESMMKASPDDWPSNVFYFRGLKDTKYYFQLKGNFYSSFISEGVGNSDYVWKDITIDVVNQIDSEVPDKDENNPLEQLDITLLGYEAIRNDKLYTLVSFKLSDGSRFQNNGSTLNLRLSENSDMSDPIKSVYNTCGKGEVSGGDFYFLNLKNMKYYVELTCDFLRLGKSNQIIEHVVIRDSIDLASNPLTPLCEFAGYTTVVSYEDGESEKSIEYAVIKSVLPNDCTVYPEFSVARMYNLKGESKDYSFASYCENNQVYSLFPKSGLVQDAYYLSFKGLNYKTMTLWDLEVPINKSIDFADNDKEFVLFDDIWCRLIEYDDVDMEGNKSTSIEVVMPEYSWFYSPYSISMYASDNPEMKNKIKNTSCTTEGRQGKNIFKFPILEKKPYYFELRGALIYHLGEFWDVVIRIKNSVDLSPE